MSRNNMFPYTIPKHSVTFSADQVIVLRLVPDQAIGLQMVNEPRAFFQT